MAHFVTQLIPMKDGVMGTPIDITADGVIVGREDDCDCTVKGDGVSRYHACFYRDGDAVFVEDLESTNGVSVNGREVRNKLELRPEDVVTIAEFEFVIGGHAGNTSVATGIRIGFLLAALLGALIGVYQLSAYLKRQQARQANQGYPLTLLSDPAGAMVYNHGKRVGQTPLTLKDIKKGRYRLLLRMNGYNDLQLTVTIPQGATRKIHVLEPQLQRSRQLVVTTLPANAKVYVDGTYMGTTEAPASGVGESLPLKLDNVDLSVPHKVHMMANGKLSEIVLTETWSPDISLMIWEPDTLITTKAGNMLVGMIRRKTSTGDIVLARSGDQHITIPKAEVDAVRPVLKPKLMGKAGIEAAPGKDGVMELTVDPFPDE